MPDVKMPDGTVIRNVPEGTTRAQLMARYGKAAPQQADSRPKSFWQGVKEGVSEPLYNMARLMETADENTGGVLKTVGDAIATPINAAMGRVFGERPDYKTVNAAETAFKKKQARAPYQGSATGKFVGNVAGTLPTAVLPGGPFAQGAMAGGLLTKNREPDLIAAEMLMSGLIGKAGDKVVRGIAGKVAPKVSDSLRQLTQRGVRVTPGQATRESQGIGGRLLSSFEDRGTSLPGPTGQLIRAGRQRSSEDFVRGGVDDVLREIGKSLPKTVPAGNKAVDFAQKAAGGAYDDALKGMRLVPDDKFKQDVGALITNAQGGGLAGPQLSQFRTIVKNSVLRRAENKPLAGDNLKTIMSELNGRASKYSSSSVASERELGDAISALADTIEGAARRSSPKESVNALDAANRAYAKLVRVEGAAKNASGGLFTPGQLETAIRQADTSVRKRAVAAGRGLMQDYAEAGRNILPSSIGDSGTAGREAMWSLTPWLVDLAAYAPYRAATAVVPGAATRQPGAMSSSLADLLNASAPTAARVSPVIGQGLLGDR